VLGAVVPPQLAPDRRHAASLAAGALLGCALLALVDPDESGPYPPCPTQALLGLDCPACGTLRGVHALSRGRIVEALDHNLLLLLAAPIGLLVWLGWVRAALGRPPIVTLDARRVPRWTVPALALLAGAFAILRNLPLEGLAWLGSAA